MQKLIYLPNVELNMEGVRVTEWRVRVGDHVAVDQMLMEVETQKAAVEVPSPEAGYVRKLCVAAKSEVAEKALLCILTDAADEPFEEDTGGGAAPVPEPADRAVSSGGGPDGGEGIRSVPLARKMAREAGIALETITGTGPNGRITVADVEGAIAGRGAAPAGKPAARQPGEWTPLPPSRVALNQQMLRSLSEIPQIHLTRQFDVTPLTRKEGATFTHRLIVAAALALARHPALRTRIDEERIQVQPVSVAVAMETPHGLVAPVIRDADSLSVDDIARALDGFRDRALRNVLRREELVDGPFAISNLGMFGVDFFTAFVFHGQTAVLAVGRAASTPAGRKVAWFSLALDHRVVDGAEGARFLESLQQAILEGAA